MFLISWIAKTVLWQTIGKYIVPVFDFALKHWKITAFLLLLASNVYAFNKVSNLKEDIVEYDNTISMLHGNILKLRLGIDAQNEAIEEGAIILAVFEEKQKDAVKEIAELEKLLQDALSSGRDVTIGDACEDKINYLRNSAKDLKWTR